MSFASLLTHDLTHVRIPRDITDLDDYGQPTEGTAVETAVKGLVQPLGAREMLDSRSAGVEVADHKIFVGLMDLAATDHFLYEGDRYEIQNIQTRRYGSQPHLAILARRVGAAVTT